MYGDHLLGTTFYTLNIVGNRFTCDAERHPELNPPKASALVLFISDGTDVVDVWYRCEDCGNRIQVTADANA